MLHKRRDCFVVWALSKSNAATTTSTATVAHSTTGA
jgi:hypothetical protein